MIWLWLIALLLQYFSNNFLGVASIHYPYRDFLICMLSFLPFQTLLENWYRVRCFHIQFLYMLLDMVVRCLSCPFFVLGQVQSFLCLYLASWPSANQVLFVCPWPGPRSILLILIHMPTPLFPFSARWKVPSLLCLSSTRFPFPTLKVKTHMAIK